MEVELLNTIEIKGKKYGVVEEDKIQILIRRVLCFLKRVTFIAYYGKMKKMKK